MVSTSMAHSTVPHAPLFCSLHILMSTMIYYWTVTWQHKIYLSNGITIHLTFFFPFFVFFCSSTHECAMKTGSHLWVSWEKQSSKKNIVIIAPIKWWSRWLALAVYKVHNLLIFEYWCLNKVLSCNIVILREACLQKLIHIL